VRLEELDEAGSDAFVTEIVVRDAPDARAERKIVADGLHGHRHGCLLIR
jgi:hypothetical protein